MFRANPCGLKNKTQVAVAITFRDYIITKWQGWSKPITSRKVYINCFAWVKRNIYHYIKYKSMTIKLTKTIISCVLISMLALACHWLHTDEVPSSGFIKVFFFTSIVNFVISNLLWKNSPTWNSSKELCISILYQTTHIE